MHVVHFVLKIKWGATWTGQKMLASNLYNTTRPCIFLLEYWELFTFPSHAFKVSGLYFPVFPYTMAKWDRCAKELWHVPWHAASLFPQYCPWLTQGKVEWKRPLGTYWLQNFINIYIIILYYILYILYILCCILYIIYNKCIIYYTYIIYNIDRYITYIII